MNSKLTMLVAAVALLLAAVPVAHAADGKILPFRGYRKHEMQVLFVPAAIEVHDASSKSPVGETYTAFGPILAKDLKTKVGNFTQTFTVVGVVPAIKPTYRIVTFDLFMEMGPKGDNTLVVKGQFETLEPFQGLQTAFDMDAIIVGGRGK